jgi:putative DNA primase/helicase
VAGGWVNGLDGTPWVPYRLPAILAADPKAPVFIVEVEKDIKRLEQSGVVAPTNPFGAGKWRLEFTSISGGIRS